MPRFKGSIWNDDEEYNLTSSMHNERETKRLDTEIRGKHFGIKIHAFVNRYNQDELIIDKTDNMGQKITTIARITLKD